MSQSQILFYVHQQPMVPDHGTKYEENPSSHDRWMWKDGQTDDRTDWQTNGLGLFLYSKSAIAEQERQKNSYDIKLNGMMIIDICTFSHQTKIYHSVYLISDLSADSFQGPFFLFGEWHIVGENNPLLDQQRLLLIWQP